MRGPRALYRRAFAGLSVLALGAVTAACAILVVLPVVVIFFLCQRPLIEGITLTAVKG